MSRFRSFLLFLAALFAISITVACAQQTAQKPAAPPDTRKADEAAIRTASADWSKASQAKDLDKATSYYADDAIFFVNNGAMVKGKDAIKMAWKQELATPGAELTFETAYVEVARSGDLAYEYGTYDEKTEVRKGKVKDEKGKYVVVWKKQPNGEWKAVADIDNIGE
ncbi:MAG: SgcJ/EcaC family oxidoreductase [Candidatus Acidiferrales bacterium]